MSTDTPRNPDHDLDEKAAAYADAIIISITATAQTLGLPDINAALVALAYAEGYLLSGLPMKDRLSARKILIERMDRDTRDFVNLRALAAAKPQGNG